MAIDSFFSNPYVSYEERSKDRDAMFAALQAQDEPSFRRGARKYGVSYVVVEGELAQRWLAEPHPLLTKVFDTAGIVAVFRVAPER